MGNRVIKIDMKRICPNCSTTVPVMQSFTVYPDAEYSVCHSCGCKTKWIPQMETYEGIDRRTGQPAIMRRQARDPKTGERLYTVEWYKLDPDKPSSDFKRNDPRHYRPRGGGKEDDEDEEY